MNHAGAPAFERGVRLRREPDGSAMLLVPEGVVMLNGSAAAALALVDGERTIDQIAAEIARANFDAPSERIAEDVRVLFDRLHERRLVRL
jgi:pyrroloquinoline quinone biosynthesis protein D